MILNIKYYQKKKIFFLMNQSQLFAGMDVSNYLKTRVLPLLQPLQMDILDNRPIDVKSFAYMWLRNFKQNQNKMKKEIHNNEQDDEEPDQIFKQKIRKRKQGRNKFRIGVLGQTTVKHNQNYDKVDQNMTFVRTEHSKIKILIELKNSILFKDMNHSAMMKIIQLMRVKQYKQGDIVIKQGDQGNQLFIVDEGNFRCVFIEKKLQEKVYGPGQAFGELSLLYNTKRASTIIAETDGRLYSLGRAQFNSILRQNVKKKTEMCERILNNIDIFQTLDRYQKSKVYEALKEIQVMAGKYIIKEGEIGDCFYIVAEGKLVAEKQQNDQIKPVYYYKEGDYFGQLAILKNIVRQASVKALTKVRLLYIERSSFKRLLGSIEVILRRNQTRYKSPHQKKLKKRKISLEKQNNML